jgi:hypothetical protein
MWGVAGKDLAMNADHLHHQRQYQKLAGLRTAKDRVRRVVYLQFYKC